MTPNRAALVLLLTLAACGAAGAPEAPQPGLTISGTATMGIARDGGA